MKYFIPALFVLLLVVLFLLFWKKGGDVTSGAPGSGGAVKCPMSGLTKDIQGLQI